MVEYSPPKKGMESERNLSLTLSSINPKISLETHKISHPDFIFDKPGHGQMR